MPQRSSLAFPDFFLDFLIAAAVGGLVGVEREHRADDAMVIAGVRTFPLISISGFLVALLAQETGSPFVVAAGVAGAFGLSFMFIQARHRLGFSGFTTPAVLVVTFLLGILIGYGYRFEGVVVGVAATFLLVTKQRLHRFAQYLDEQEILSALQFVTVVFILLPLTATLSPPVLEQDWIGRGALLDPFLILTIVVFVSTISFVSLLVMRQVGPRRGLEFSGLLGGLVNSEATTASLAQRSKEEPSLLSPVIVGALLATTMMLLRNLAIAAFADPGFDLVLGMLPFMLPAFLVGGLFAWHLGSKHGEPIPGIRVKNPFAVGPALQFAGVYLAVSLLTTLAQTSLGDAGVYVAALGGFVSAGAVVASLASLHAAGGVGLGVAISTAVLANAASVAGKLFILRAVDRRAFERARVPFMAMSLAAILGAGAALLLA